MSRLSPVIRGHAYVPDVAVIDVAVIDVAKIDLAKIDLAMIEPGQTIVGRRDLAAEILSPSDQRELSGTGRRAITVKRAGYEAMPACEVVLLVEPRAFDVTVSERQGGEWLRRRLTGPDAHLVVASAVLACRLADLYARTTLARKQDQTRVQ